ncbi:MAG: hypothetical protein WCJ86_02055 [Candidatus Saccharibacteria bacterium]
MNQDKEQPPTVVNLESTGSNALPVTAQITSSKVSEVNSNPYSQAPEVAVASRPSSNFNDMLSNQSVDNSNAPKKKMGINMKSKKTTVAFLMILAALTIGFAISFYLVYYVNNKPASVIKNAMTKLMDNKNTKNFELNRVTTVEGVVISDVTKKITLNSNNDYRFNTEIKSNGQVRSSSVIFKSKDKELYIKVDSPTNLLKLYSYDQKPLEQASVDALAGKWLRFDDISFSKNASTPFVSSNQVSACIDSFKKYSTDTLDIAKNLTDAYKMYDNIYIKGNASNIDGVKTTIYKSNYGVVNSTAKTKDIVEGFYTQQSDALGGCFISNSLTLSDDVKNSIVLNSATFDIDTNRNILASENIVTITSNKVKNTSRYKYHTQELDTSTPKDFVDAKVFTKDQATYSWLLAILRASVRINVN